MVLNTAHIAMFRGGEIIMYWVHLLLSNHQHKDYYTFLVGHLELNLHLPLLLGWGLIQTMYIGVVKLPHKKKVP